MLNLGPGGFIAIAASTGGSFNGSSAVMMEENSAQTSAFGKASQTASPDSRDGSEAEIDELVSKDLVGPLRSTSSAKSILKQPSLSSELESQESGKIKRAVSWHDFEGKNLHTVREFVPSEHDDAELLYNPGEPKQCCVIC